MSMPLNMTLPNSYMKPMWRPPMPILNKLKNLFNKVDSYIGLDGSKLFDEELARENNESQEIIDIGLAYNEMLSAEQQGNYDKVNRHKRAVINGLSHYGNWCGKGNNGKKPIDILDAQCKKHDNCYSANGMWHSKCDVQFVYNIARNFGQSIKLVGVHELMQLRQCYYLQVRSVVHLL